MKYIPFALLTFAVIGCGHNEFDVSPAQVSRHKGTPGPAAENQVRLPPEAFTTGIKVKKGDQLPDRTIADQDGTLKAGPDKK